MSDPKRWLDDASGATEIERELLEVGRHLEPPERAHGKVWAALAAQLLVGGGAAGGGAAGGAGAAGGPASVPGAGATAASGGAGGTAAGPATLAGSSASPSGGGSSALHATAPINSKARRFIEHTP